MEDIEKALDTELNFTHITYKEKIKRSIDELMDTDPNDVIKRGRKKRDDAFGGIYGGKVYLIGAKTGVGKSTFINQICKNVSNQGIKVVKYSLEDRMEDIGKEELYFEVNRIRYKNKQSPYTRPQFLNNEIKTDQYYSELSEAVNILEKIKIIELDKEKQVSIDDLVYLMEKECDEGARMFAIDHLHYFEFEKVGERLDLQIQNVMHRINEVARKRNVAIFLIAHYKSNLGLSEPNPDRFKDGASIKQVANVIIQIERDGGDENSSTFYITKLRGPIKAPEISANFDLSKFQYDFEPSHHNNQAGM